MGSADKGQPADAESWKADFQKLCQTYGMTGCNKATIYMQVARRSRENTQNADLKRLFIYAICDDDFLLDQQENGDQNQLQKRFLQTEKRMRKLLELMRREKTLHLYWQEVLKRKHCVSDDAFCIVDYDEELIALCHVFRETFEMTEKQSPNLADNLQYFLIETRNDMVLRRITPLYLFQLMVRHTSRLAQNQDFQANIAGLWKYKAYEIEKNNGKNFNQYERYILLFQKLCKYYKKDIAVNIELCRYGMEQCSNLPEWTAMWMPKKEKKCITKLHRCIENLYLSCISYEKAERESLDALSAHKKKEEEILFSYDLYVKQDLTLRIKWYVLDHMELLIKFMENHYSDMEQIKCILSEVYKRTGLDQITIEGVSEETKLNYITELLEEMLDDAIVSSVWQTIDKLVECERDHFRCIADMLS